MLCIAVIVFLGYVYWSSLTRVYRVNRDAYKKLRALAYMEESFYEPDLLPIRFYVFGLVINLWNYGLIAALILNIRWPYLS